MILQIPIYYWYIQLSLKELMEFLPLLPSDDPANKQPVEVSATMLSKKEKKKRRKSLILQFIYQKCNQDLANQSARLE